MKGLMVNKYEMTDDEFRERFKKGLHDPSNEYAINYFKEWRLNNPEEYRKYNREYQSKRYKKDINFRLTCILRARVKSVLRGKNKSEHTLKLLGCSLNKLKQHLEKQFKPGMTWKNYGLWHIDHIKPCAKFDLSKPSEQRKCFNYKNLQPLWAIDNLRKSDNYENT
jgi:hypothetical protein